MHQTAVSTAHLQLVKETNLALIFDLVYRQSPISRTSLAFMTHLSPTTVSSLIDELRQKNLVQEIGSRQAATSGRRPVLLDINASGAGMVALELVPNGFKCGLYDLRCRKIAGLAATVADYRELSSQLAAAAASILGEQGYGDRLLGISLAVPGLIDPEQKRVISSTVVPVDAGFDLRQDLATAFPGIPVILENESSLCAYAEKEFGQGSGVRNLVYLDINRGIGAGIILEGRLFRGSWGIAGEAGHISIDRNGPHCRCGNNGCLEIMAGVPALLQLAAQLFLTGQKTLIRDLTAGDLNRIDTDVIRQALDQGDEAALAVTAEIARRLACGVNSVANLFNPDVIAIGGEISRLGESLIRLLNESLAAIALKVGRHRLAVNYAVVKEDAALLGGARYVLDTVFRRSAVFGDS